MKKNELRNLRVQLAVFLCLWGLACAYFLWAFLGSWVQSFHYTQDESEQFAQQLAWVDDLPDPREWLAYHQPYMENLRPLLIARPARYFPMRNDSGFWASDSFHRTWAWESHDREIFLDEQHAQALDVLREVPLHYIDVTQESIVWYVRARRYVDLLQGQPTPRMQQLAGNWHMEYVPAGGRDFFALNRQAFEQTAQLLRDDPNANWQSVVYLPEVTVTVRESGVAFRYNSDHTEWYAFLYSFDGSGRGFAPNDRLHVAMVRLTDNWFVAETRGPGFSMMMMVMVILLAVATAIFLPIVLMYARKIRKEKKHASIQQPD